MNNQRALRLEPNLASPNVVGGYMGNATGAGAAGASIGGGGDVLGPQTVRANHGTIA